MNTHANPTPCSIPKLHPAGCARAAVLVALSAFALSFTGCENAPGAEGSADHAVEAAVNSNGGDVETATAALGIAGGEAGLRKTLANRKNGDILVARGPLISGIYPPWALRPGDFTHAGIFDKAKFDAGDSNCILTANLQGVGYENIAHWANDQDTVAFFRAKNYSDAGAEKAVAFARSIIGKKYNITSTLNDNNAYYCSKLVYRAWGAAGVSFKTFWIYGINLTDRSFKLYYVSPNNLAESSVAISD